MRIMTQLSTWVIKHRILSKRKEDCARGAYCHSDCSMPKANRINGKMLNNHRYADDTSLIAVQINNLPPNIETVNDFI